MTSNLPWWHLEFDHPIQPVPLQREETDNAAMPPLFEVEQEPGVPPYSQHVHHVLPALVMQQAPVMGRQETVRVQHAQLASMWKRQCFSWSVRRVHCQ